MTQILMPVTAGVQGRDSTGDWEMVEKTLPQGFRHVATVDRPNGDIFDLGQNAEGQFAMFRRSVDPWLFYSHGKAERLSDEDVQGFGLLRAVCYDPPEDQGEFSSLCKSHLLTLN
jgi:hypothetical protein